MSRNYLHVCQYDLNKKQHQSNNNLNKKLSELINLSVYSYCFHICKINKDLVINKRIK